jgi:hypothetical protein
LTGNGSTQPATGADRPKLERALRLRDIVAEVGKMIARSADLGDDTQAESLRVLLRHFESELAHLEPRQNPGASGGTGAAARHEML